MSTPFPSGFNLERSSQFARDLNIDSDIMDDGETRLRVKGAKMFTTIRCVFRYITQTDRDTLVTFLETNRAETITWTIDSVDYSGFIISDVGESMTGVLFNIAFTYRAEEV